MIGLIISKLVILQWCIFNNSATKVNDRRLRSQTEWMLSDLLDERHSLMPFEVKADDHNGDEQMAASLPRSLKVIFHITRVFDKENVSFIGKKVEIIAFRSQSPSEEQRAMSPKVYMFNKNGTLRGRTLNDKLITYAQRTLQCWLLENYKTEYFCAKSGKETIGSGRSGVFTIACVKRLNLEHFNSVSDYADYLADVERYRFTSC